MVASNPWVWTAERRRRASEYARVAKNFCLARTAPLAPLHPICRPRPAVHRASCHSLVYADCFFLAGDRRLHVHRPPTGREPQHDRAASQDRCGQSGFCKCDPFPLFFSSDPLRSSAVVPCVPPHCGLGPRAPSRGTDYRRRDAVGTPTHIASRIWASGANGAHELQPFAAVSEGGAESAKLHINHHSRIQPGPTSTCSCSTAEHLRTP